MAERYKVAREDLDEYSLLSQQRTAAAQASGKFADEIVAMDTVMNITNKETGEVSPAPPAKLPALPFVCLLPCASISSISSAA